MADFDWDKPDKQTFAWDTAQPVSPAETGPVVGAKSAE